MNKIERQFYDEYIESCCGEEEDSILKPGQVIGIYKVDFLYDDEIVVEIDGHEYHKTKEQREKDYKRERYLMDKGYIVVRFTGTEVFLEPERCVEEMLEIACTFEQKRISHYDCGFAKGVEFVGKV